MDSDLIYIINSVTEKTGIQFSVVPYADESSAEVRAVPRGSTLKKGGKTYFRFTFRSAEYIAAVTGDDGVSENYAFLLRELLENSSGAEAFPRMSEYLKKIMFGECGTMQIEKFHTKFNIPDIACYALVISYPQEYAGEIMNVLNSYANNSLDTPLDTDDGFYAFVKFTEQGEAEYQSTGEYAEYLVQSVFEELGAHITVGVGTVAPHLTELNQSYRQALTALKMSRVFNDRGAVHSYKEYVLVKMLQELPRAKLREYLDVLTGEEGKEIFGDPDMVGTAEEFLENSLNVSETSRKLFMHRNTLIYRLDKIEKSTGLNIKNFSDAVTFRIVSILGKLLKNS